MVQQLPQRDIGGDIGRAFSQSLSEQLPREMQANRLAQAYQEFQKQDIKPGEMPDLSKILSVPGGLKSLNSLLPMIQRNQQIKAMQNRVAQEENKSLPSVNESLNQIPPDQTSEKVLNPGLVSAQEIQKMNQARLQPPTQRDIDKLATQYLNSGEVFDPIEARQRAESTLNTNLASQEAQLTKFRNELNSDMALALQSGGLNDYQKSVGEITKGLRDYGEYLVNVKGMSSQAARQDVVSKILELSKAEAQTKAISSGFTKSASEKETDLRAQQKIFEKYGFGDLYDDIASSAVGITPMKAASILHPSKNENFEKELKKFPNPADTGYKTGSTYKPTEKEIDRLVSFIKPEDNILSLLYQLREKKVNISSVRDRLLEDDIYTKLTKQQQYQLGKPARNSILDDLAFKWF